MGNLKKARTYQRTCPRCENLHQTTAKSNKAVCDECKLNKAKTTKTYREKMYRQKRRKMDKEWSLAVREKPCLICGSTQYLNAHHIIPREVGEHRHEPMNGVSLCAKHHKYSYQVSAHKHPAMFFHILQKKSPEQYDWLVNTMTVDYLNLEDVV